MPDLVFLDLEDAQAIAQNISEHLQYDGEEEGQYWRAILERLSTAIAHSATS